MKTINDFNFKNKKVLIRVDFNVPLNDKQQITDDSRIVAAIPTIKKVLQDGGSPILMSHLGRPKATENKFSLSHIVDYLSKKTETKVQFANDCIGNVAFQKAKALKNSEILLLENLRFYKEEKKGDKDFASKLSQLADFYINDAFGTAHRAHASTSVIADFFPNNKCFGYLMVKEIINIEKVLKDSKKPFTAILGGAKVSDKVLIIENLLPKIDNLLIGGGMAYTFIKAQGGNIGKSLVEKDSIAVAKEIFIKAKEQNVEIFLPQDSLCADDFSNEANIISCPSDEVPDNRMGLDIGEKAIKKYSEIIEASETILWNGPMGVFEFDNFQKGSKEIANAVANATKKGAFSLIGGGDSVAAIKKFGFEKQVSYISTGGGAMLEFLEGKELQGIKAMKK
ncbi:MAG: phosphoglycerate kinase [Bacteroidota bacterium]|nr:phosphoglycerate kinase [Bacteroidota bacterium]